MTLSEPRGARDAFITSLLSTLSLKSKLIDLICKRHHEVFHAEKSPKLMVQVGNWELLNLSWCMYGHSMWRLQPEEEEEAPDQNQTVSLREVIILVMNSPDIKAWHKALEQEYNSLKETMAIKVTVEDEVKREEGKHVNGHARTSGLGAEAQQEEGKDCQLWQI
eukprot:6281244-Amphidinium_carterae.1